MAQRLTIYTSFGNLTLLVADDWTPHWPPSVDPSSSFHFESIQGEHVHILASEIRGTYLDPNPDPFLVGLANPAAEGEAPDA